MSRIFRLFLLVFLLAFSANVIGQTKPNATKTYTAVIEGYQDLSVLNHEDSVRVQIQFYDGLGRPIQSVTRWGSPKGEDVVQHIVYDDFGRQAKTFLPFVSATNPGGYKPLDLSDEGYSASEHYTFYNNVDSDIVTSEHPFAESIFEHSPMNRVLQQGAPGETWQPLSLANPEHGGKVIESQYYVNEAADNVYHWSYRNDGIVVNGAYPTGELMKMVTIDENQNQFQEFTDKRGRTILKRVFLTPSEFADTYYIYGDDDLLYYVFQPELSKVLMGSTPTVVQLEQFAFQYKYDDRRRMIEKRVPGSGWVFMVYDDRDRLVLTQDANQRESSQWIFTKYDHLNRPVSTGFYSGSQNRTTEQSLVDDFYNNQSNVYYETRGSAAHGYDNASYPNISTEGDYLTITYYDDYSFIDNSILTNTGESFDYKIFNGYDETYFSRLKGQIVGSKTRVLGKADWIHSVMYYDDRYRLIQTISYNSYQNVLDRSFTNYAFNGEILSTKNDQSRIDQGTEYATSRKFDLDHMGRVESIYHGLMHRLNWTPTSNTNIDINQHVVLIDQNQIGTAKAAFSIPANSDGGFIYVDVDNGVGRDILLDDGTNTYSVNQYTNTNYTVMRINGSQTVYYNESEIGAVYRIERRGDTMYYYINDVLEATRSVDGSKELSLHVRLLEAGSTLDEVYGFSSYQIVKNTYNELGELSNKGLHVTNNVPFQSVDYKYNIRGWLTDINDPKSLLDASSDNDDFFSMTLAYEEELQALTSTTSTNTISPMDDAYVRMHVPEANYGSSKIVPVTSHPTDTRYSYYKFDVSAYNDIDNATLRLYSHLRSGHPPNEIFVYKVADDSWIEETINYNNRPSAGDEVTSIPYDQAEQWYEFDLTSYVQDEINNDGIVSFVLKSFDAESLNFRSKEKGAEGPQLVITWSEVQAQNPDPEDIDVTNVIPTDDSFARMEEPDKLNGTRRIIPVLTNPNDTRFSFLRFDISEIENIHNAKLFLYSHARSGLPPNEVTFFAVENDNWNEETLNWNNMPESSYEIGRMPYDQDEMWYEVDLTQYVKTQFEKDGIVSLVMKSFDIETLNFRSKEQGGFEPYLRIESLNENYTAPAIEGNEEQYNGNISSMVWKGHSDDKVKAYAFKYDGMNRLKEASYFQGRLIGKVLDRSGLRQHHFSVNNLLYDLNGNIQSLNRNTVVSGITSGMDALSYTYEGNRLLSVSDASASSGFFDGNTNGNDYEYDLNGNLEVDRNKDISSIEYNHLNLPSKVTKGDGKYIEYVYDAAGIKLQQIVHDTEIRNTDYLGEYIFANDTLQLIQHDEGRIVPNLFTGNLDYQYHLKDHLGNIRVSLTTAPNVLEFTNNYEDDPSMPDDSELFEEDDTQVGQISTVDLFDHTDETGTVYTDSRLLNGDEGNRVGSILTIPVGKGDIVSAEVFGKYEEITSTPNTVASSIGMTVISALLTEGASLGEFGGGNSTSAASDLNELIAASQVESGFDPAGIQGFLNLFFISDDGKKTKFAIDQISGGQQSIGDATKNPHDRLAIDDFEVPANGVIVVYLSNEHDMRTNIYFDDIKLTVAEHPVIQSDDYYPFGLTFNSSNRQTQRKNTNLYNDGTERLFDLDLKIDLTQFRVMDPELGRWWQTDALTDKSNNVSPYSYVMNNPLRYSDAAGLDTLDEVVVKGKRIVSNQVNRFVNWFTGANVGYRGSGWGHGFRRVLADQLALGNSANNIFELGLHSQLQSDQVNLTGSILEKIKSDPEMVKFQNDIIKLLKSDPRFKSVQFVKKGREVIGFGGYRWRSNDEDWFSVGSNNPLAHSATWNVATNELTWATRNATIDYNATVKTDGTIVISFQLTDTLDLSAQQGRGEAYNTISEATGFLYHDIVGGNSSMKVNANWEVRE